MALPREVLLPGPAADHVRAHAPEASALFDHASVERAAGPPQRQDDERLGRFGLGCVYYAVVVALRRDPKSFLAKIVADVDVPREMLDRAPAASAAGVRGAGARPADHGRGRAVAVALAVFFAAASGGGLKVLGGQACDNPTHPLTRTGTLTRARARARSLPHAACRRAAVPTRGSFTPGL